MTLTLTRLVACVIVMVVSITLCDAGRCDSWGPIYYKCHNPAPGVTLQCHYMGLTQRCCPGFIDLPECDIHSQPLVVDDCPIDITITAPTSTSPATVTWMEPRFIEPHGHPLDIIRPYDSFPVLLPIGTHDIEIVATSTNNNMQAVCKFTVTVNPPTPSVTVKNYNYLQNIWVYEGQTVTLLCEALLSPTKIKLEWYMKDELVIDGHSLTYRQSQHAALPNYWDSFNNLTFVARAEHDQQQLVCKGQGLDPGQDSFLLIMRVHYERDPNVDSCPTDQNLETSERTVRAHWTQPEFSDPQNDPLRVNRNIPGSVNSQIFPWGRHNVHYTAVNDKNGRSAVCQFDINVEPRPCSLPDPPANGALVCGYWPQRYIHVCIPMCHVDYDVSVSAVVWDVYYCVASGEWFPELQTTNCDVRRDQMSSNLGKSERYFHGSCTSSDTKSILETNFMTALRDSPSQIKSMYSFDSTEEVNFTIHC